MDAPLRDSYDVVVIGAGPAGASAASLLRGAGFDVAVFEKARFPRFVIGESLLPRCMDLLEEANLLEACQEQGYLVKRGALFLKGDERCSFDFSEQFTPGWDYTWQVPRDHFDKVLADTTAERGVPIFYEHAVDAVEVGASPRLSIETPEGSKRDIGCRFIVDASGYGRVLPRLLGLDRPSDMPPRKSLFAHVRGDRRPAGDDEGRIWIVTHRQDVWMWIIPFSNGATSVGVVGSPGFFDEFPSDPAEALQAILAAEPITADRLGGAEQLFRPKVIEGYSVAVERLFGEGYCLVGNTTEFLDPVFSSGVTLALESANRASKVLIRQLRGEPTDWQRDYADYLMGGVDTFRAYVNAWYDGSLPKVFYAPDAVPEIKRMVCSVLAGYVWDRENPFVREPERRLAQLGIIIAGR